jgi:hypothetical protein
VHAAGAPVRDPLAAAHARRLRDDGSPARAAAAAPPRDARMTDATRSPLAWPIGWTRTAHRRAAAFSTNTTRQTGDGRQYRQRATLTVGDGLARLAGELRRLGARQIVISSNLRTNQDGTIATKQAKNLEDPGVAVYFRLHDAPRVLACDRWTSAADNMAAIAGHIEAMRAQGRYGVGTLDQAFAGYAALPPIGGSQGGDWRAELEIAPDARDLTLTTVEAQYRRLLITRHPDRGGSHDAIVRLNLARDAARAYFKDAPV